MVWQMGKLGFTQLRRQHRSPDLLTVTEAARSLGITKRELYMRVRTLEVVTVWMDGERFIPESELKRYRLAH